MSARNDPESQRIDILQGEARATIEAALPGYLLGRRWFGGKARTIRSVEIVEAVPLSGGASGPFLTLVRVNYTAGDPQTYVIPMGFAAGRRAEEVRRETPQAVLTQVNVAAEGQGQGREGEGQGQGQGREGEGEGQGEGVVYDASWDKGFASSLLEMIREGRRFQGTSGTVVAWPMQAFRPARADTSGRRDFGLWTHDSGLSDLEPSIMKAEQSNTSVAYGDRFILKLFRRLEEGTSPELEVGRFLVERGFANTPPLAGAIEHHRVGREPITLAVLQGFVPNRGDAWQYTLDSLARYFEAGWEPAGGEDLLHRGRHLLDTLEEEAPAAVRDAIGPYLASARLLARRTAEMHRTLASLRSEDPVDPAFAPEPFDARYRWSTYEAMRDLTAHAFLLLSNSLDKLPEETRAEAEAIAERQHEVMARFRPLVEREIGAIRCRCHGDYHLAQVLYTGADFMIIDFEGEPVRSLAERRRKHSPLKDVAGMLRSFHYAAASAVQDQMSKLREQAGDARLLERWADAWFAWVSAAFLREYLAVAAPGSFLPQAREDLQALLDVYLLEKAVYELIYELNNRPGWVGIPLRGVKQIMGF